MSNYKRFPTPVTSNSNDDIAIVNKLKTLPSRSYELRERIEKESLSSKRAIWSEMSPKCIQSIPRFTENDLRALT